MGHNVSESTLDFQRRIDALEERISRLSAATLRLNSSLDLDYVLQEVVDSARVLTSAGYGVITTVDTEGQIEEFVTSGFTREEKDRMAAWPDGPKLFAHLRDIGESIRVADPLAYVSALGFSTHVMISAPFQATPLCYREKDIGIFFLSQKEGNREFNDADEDVLRPFAAQAATAIANARTYRNELRARADLQTLIETSPVGVVVFDGNTGQPASLNREARRIVQELATPGESSQDLLNSVTCRRADGREISLAEFPMSRQLSNEPETIYAEEMMLSVPDGRNVTILCNSTPVRATGGAVESLVVTLQDLAPLEELTRLRAEFLSKVSDELRAPMIAIKGSSASVLGAKPRPDADEMLQYIRVIDDHADQMRGLIADLLDYGRIATGTLELSPVEINVSNLIEQSCAQFFTELKPQPIKVNVSATLPHVFVDPSRVKQVI